jgi:hypothetical protein
MRFKAQKYTKVLWHSFKFRHRNLMRKNVGPTWRKATSSAHLYRSTTPLYTNMLPVEEMIHVSSSVDVVTV